MEQKEQQGQSVLETSTGKPERMDYKAAMEFTKKRAVRRWCENTTVEAAYGDMVVPYFKVRYHGSIIVVLRKNGTTLFSRGWMTSSTKDRINACLPEGWSVTGKCRRNNQRHDGTLTPGKWTVRGPNGLEIPFKEGMVIQHEENAGKVEDISNSDKVPA